MFCRRTNGHGWRRIVRAPTLRGTTIWFVLTYLFFGGGLIYTFIRWSNYINYETGEGGKHYVCVLRDEKNT